MEADGNLRVATYTSAFSISAVGLRVCWRGYHSSNEEGKEQCAIEHSEKLRGVATRMSNEGERPDGVVISERRLMMMMR
jgi:hypothetical protein